MNINPTSTATQTKKLVRASAVAAALDVHKRTVELWAQKNTIPHYRIAGIVRFDLDEVMASLRTKSNLN